MLNNKFYSKSRYEKRNPNVLYESIFENKTLYQKFCEIQNKDFYINEPVEYYAGELKLAAELVKDIILKASFENDLEPIKINKNLDSQYENNRRNITLILSYLLKKNSKKIENVIFAPWIRGGGADLHIISICNAFSFAGKNVLLFLSEPSQNEWMDRLPSNVTVIDLSKIWRNVPFDHFSQIINAYLKLINIKTFHVMNCYLGWMLIKKYGKTIKSNFKVVVSLFCYDYTSLGEPVGYARLMQRVAKNVDLILTDNSAFIDKLDYQYKVKLFCKYKVFPHVFDHVTFKPHNISSRKFLWASRFDVQKNLDVMIDIAKLLPECEFHVFGAPMLDGENIIHTKIMNNSTECKNLIYKGKFNGYESIDTSDYAGFIYTSIWDGLPNIVMEAVSGGLPTIAPKIGGLGIELPEPHLYLVEGPYDLNGYVDQVKKIIHLSQDESNTIQINARAFIDLNFSLSQQLVHLKDIGY